MSRLIKQPVAPFNPWDFAREPGERVYAQHGEGVYMYDLCESSGRNKRDAGELSYRVVKKNGKPRIAVRDKTGIWYWSGQDLET